MRKSPGFQHLSLALLLLCAAPILSAAPDPLPAWRDGDVKSAIVAFVQRVTEANSPDFVPVAERIATFDNDGTLWAEQPLYFQGMYVLDRIKAMAPEHPEWKTTEPYKSALAGDMKAMMAQSQAALVGMLLEAHANVTEDEFNRLVTDWLATARHPATGMLLIDMVYQPMLELMDYLRANGFKVFIVSGGGIDFIRAFSETRYGVPPEQVVGTTADAKYELRDGIPTLTKTSKLILVDDKAGKPVGIHRFIGRRPILAAGNSDGDLQMLQYTTIPRNGDDTTPRLGLIVHHTDAEREFAYDRKSSIGHLEQALDEAPERGWLVVDMKKDWQRIYPVTDAR